MKFEFPSDDDPIFDERIDLYEAYWVYVDGVRYVKPVLKQSQATKADKNRSPLARHYNHLYRKKEEYKAKCRDLPGSLPKYKDHFEEPKGDVRKIPKRELEKLGIEYSPSDDPIWLPVEYELPAVWDDDLENTTVEELKEVVSRLRKENTELQEERDELREQLDEIRRLLRDGLDSTQSREDAETTSSICPCEKCGKTFDSPAAKNGHKPHCDRLNHQRNLRSPELESAKKELTQLAQELPETQEQQSSVTHKETSPGEELKNLNHLLQGHL